MKTKLHFRAVGEKAFQPKLSALLVELDGHPCVPSTDIRLRCLVYELHLFCPHLYQSESESDFCLMFVATAVAVV